MNRRELLKDLGIIGGLTLVGIPLLDACSRPEDTPPPIPADKSLRASTVIIGTRELPPTAPTFTEDLTQRRKPIPEKPVEQREQEFNSVNFPYKIILPSSWDQSYTTPSLTFDVLISTGRKDIFVDSTSRNFATFYQTTVSVSRIPVGSWVKAEDYAQQNIVSFMNRLINLSQGKLPERFRPQVEKGKIAGKDGVLITGREIVFNFPNEYVYVLAMFANKDTMWSIVLYTTPEEVSSELPVFRTMLNSLKLLE